MRNDRWSADGRLHWVCATLFSVAALAASLILVGCAANTSYPLNTSAQPRLLQALPTSDSTDPTSPVQLQIGDNPNLSEYQIVAFRLDIASIRARDTSTSNWVELMGPGSVELTHSSTEPVLVNAGDAPQLTYDQLVITYTGARVTALDAAGIPYVLDYSAVPQQVIDLQSNPIVVGTTPSVITLMVDVAATVGTLSGGNRPAKFLSRALGTSSTLNSPTLLVAQSGVNNNNKQIRHVIGTVPTNGVSGNLLTVTLGQLNSTLIFQTSAMTNFENMTLATAPGTLVEVDGSTQSNGTLFADEVELIDAVTGSEMEGLLSGYNSSGFMYMVTQTGIGAGVTTTQLGQKVSVDTTASVYTVNAGTVDMTGVNAVFDDLHIFPGQQVEAESYQALSSSDPDGNSGFLYPFNVELEQQTISGTVANYTVTSGNVAQFDLLLPINGSSYLKLLNPLAMSVHVYQQANTYRTGLSAAPAILTGAVQVRGLLFCNDQNNDDPTGIRPNPLQGQGFIMVAAQISRQDN